MLILIRWCLLIRHHSSTTASNSITSITIWLVLHARIETVLVFDSGSSTTHHGTPSHIRLRTTSHWWGHLWVIIVHGTLTSTSISHHRWLIIPHLLIHYRNNHACICLLHAFWLINRCECVFVFTFWWAIWGTGLSSQFIVMDTSIALVTTWMLERICRGHYKGLRLKVKYYSIYHSV